MSDFLFESPKNQYTLKSEEKDKVFDPIKFKFENIKNINFSKSELST